MSEPAKKKPRITEDLATLGRIIHKPNTPKQRTGSQGDVASASASAGANRILVRTPGSAAANATPSARTPTASARTRRVGSAKRGAPTTPHAIRALQQRRNAVLASGGNRRRRSGVAQRETPRDDLRALSRVLAKKSKRAPSPQEPIARRRRSSLVDQDDSPAVGQAPRLSLAMKDLDEDSFHERPPRVSTALDDDDDEIETRRRALFAQDRQSLTSFVDPSIIDLNDLATGVHEDMTDQRRQLLEQDMSIHVDEFDELDEDGQTAELRAMLEGRRQSGENMDETETTDGEPTFLFRIPERSRSSLAPTVPRTPDGQVDGRDEDEDGYEDVEEEEALAEAEVDYAEDEARVETEAYFDDDNGSPVADDGSNDDDVPLREGSVPLQDEEIQAATAAASKAKAPPKRTPREINISAYGIEYPSFPMPVIKRLASTFSRQYGGSGKLSKDVLLALQQASDDFFEQVSEDLAEYATHAGRKTIEEADAVLLMKKQRILNQNTTLFSVASKYLPRELLQEVRMPQQQVKGKKRKRSAPKRRMETINEDEDES